MINTITIYLIEDEFVYRKKLHHFIESLTLFGPSLALKIILVEEPDSFYTKINQLTFRDNDIFFIDIELQTYFSGIDIAKKIRIQNAKSFIIFLTNVEDKGIEIINQNIHATSYILKGLNFDNRIVENLLHSLKSEIIRRTQDMEKYITFKNRGDVIFIKYEDILYIKSISGMRNSLLIRTIDSEQITEGSISKLSNDIESVYLYTGLKSYIFNLAHITSLNRSIGLITFDNGWELEVGTRIINKLKKVL